MSIRGWTVREEVGSIGGNGGGTCGEEAPTIPMPAPKPDRGGQALLQHQGLVDVAHVHAPRDVVAQALVGGGGGWGHGHSGA